MGWPFPADLPGACKPPFPDRRLRLSGSVADPDAEPGSGPRWVPARPPPLTVHRVLLFQVTMPGEPVDVACGVDHMVTLARSFI